MLRLCNCVTSLDVAFQLVISDLVKEEVEFLEARHGLLLVKSQLILNILKQESAIVRLIVVSF